MLNKAGFLVGGVFIMVMEEEEFVVIKKLWLKCIDVGR